MATKYLFGKNLIVNSNNYPIACSTSCSISMEHEFIETTSPTNGYAKQFLPTTYGWKLTADGLVCLDYQVPGDTNLKLLETSFLKGELLTLQWFEYPNLINQFSGTAYVESLQVKSTDNKVVKYSVTFRGVGTISMSLAESGKWLLSDCLDESNHGTLKYLFSNSSVVLGASTQLTEASIVKQMYPNFTPTLHVFSMTFDTIRRLYSYSGSTNAVSGYPSRFVVLNALSDDKLYDLSKAAGGMAGKQYLKSANEAIGSNKLIDPAGATVKSMWTTPGKSYTILLQSSEEDNANGAYLLTKG